MEKERERERESYLRRRMEMKEGTLLISCFHGSRALSKQSFH
jgi:hypothetical protein